MVVIPSKSAKCSAGCGADVVVKTNPTVFCAACKKRTRTERARKNMERLRRERGIPKGKGVAIVCARCGHTITANNHRQKYCAPCALEAMRERSRTVSAAKVGDPEAQAYSRQWFREKYRSDPSFRVSAHMRALMHASLGRGKAGRSWRTFVDYSLEDLMAHLERQFQKGMTWENRGKWHIDHIVPRSSFTYEAPDDPDFKACWALSNLRPLWAAENHSKNASRHFLL